MLFPPGLGGQGGRLSSYEVWRGAPSDRFAAGNGLVAEVFGVAMGADHAVAANVGAGRDAWLAEQTDEVMCQIAALLPPDHRGVYADHPRLRALLLERGSPFAEDQARGIAASSPSATISDAPTPAANANL